MAENDARFGEKIPASFLISRQLDQEKINFLTKRIEELLKSNNELRTGATQNEKDTHDIVLYFQREMEIKDDIILRLNEELVKCQTQLKFEVEKVRKAFEQELADVKTNSESQITILTNRLATAEADLKAVDVYRREKDQHEDIIRKLERNIQQQREQLIDAMEEQERRFLEEKAQLLKDLDEQKAAFREVALREARASMSEEVKKILADNNRMFEELRFHHMEAVHFQNEKKTLSNELTTSKREVAILADKEIEYAKQAYNRSKEIKSLRERVEQLEKQQAANIEKFKLKAKELKSTVTKELEEATLDAAGLRRLIYMKNKELKHMKSLAATILSQRTETEQFFLEALQEVKEIVRTERKNKAQQAADQQMSHQQATSKLAQLNNRSGQGGVVFPPLNIKPAHIHLLDNRKKQPDISLAELEKVTITDLQWEDKELVLRVLFAKMNGQVKQPPKPRKATQGTGAQPVFISEGALQDQDGNTNNMMGLEHFEVTGASGFADIVEDVISKTYQEQAMMQAGDRIHSAMSDEDFDQEEADQAVLQQYKKTTTVRFPTSDAQEQQEQESDVKNGTMSSIESSSYSYY